MIPLRHYLLMNFDFFNENLTINIILLIVFLLLIILYAFLSSTEAAYSSSNPLRLKVFLEEKKKGAKKAVSIADGLKSALTTLWTLKSLSLVVSTVITGYFLYNIIGKLFMASLFTVIIVSFIFIIFGEFLPKIKAMANPEKIALKNSSVMYVLFKLFYPITYTLLKFSGRVNKKNEIVLTPKVTEEELESIIDTMETEGVIDEEDAELIQSAIGLNERTVYDIMTPRVDIIAVKDNMSIEEIKEVFFEYQFSRVPLYRDDKDNIIGILSEKDFFTVLLKNEEVDLYKLVSKPIFVSESTKVNDLIKEFQKVKKHFAVVVDEYGGTSGIVTMEDALEELVGEIYDEYDDEELDDLVMISEDHYLVSPEMEIEDLFDKLDIGEIPETQYNSIGGFVYSLIGGLPVEGMVVHHYNITEENNEEVKYDLEFTIKVVKNKRIRSLELKVIRIYEVETENENQNDKKE